MFSHSKCFYAKQQERPLKKSIWKSVKLQRVKQAPAQHEVWAARAAAVETRRAGTRTCRLIIFLLLEGKKSSSKLDVPRRFSQRRKIYEINKKYDNDVESDVKLSLWRQTENAAPVENMSKALRSRATQWQAAATTGFQSESKDQNIRKQKGF